MTCSNPARREGAGRRRGRRRGELGRRVDGHGRVDAGAKHPGDQLVGATINKQGTLRACATAVGSDTALAQIVKLVQEAQNSKAPAQRLADRAAFWLVLVALVGGLGTFLVWYGIVGDTLNAPVRDHRRRHHPPGRSAGEDTDRESFGTGLGAQRGILFKSAIALEQAASLDTVVLDKTGTLTRGEPEVVDLVADGLPEDELLRLVAAPRARERAPARRGDRQGSRGAKASNRHAQSASRRSPGTAQPRRSKAGAWLVGNRRLLEREGVSLDGLALRAEEMAATGARSSTWPRTASRPACSRSPTRRRETAAAHRALEELGVRPVMLTGDNRQTAERIAAALGIEEVMAEVLPGDKAAKVAELQAAAARWPWSATG